MTLDSTLPLAANRLVARSASCRRFGFPRNRERLNESFSDALRHGLGLVWSRTSFGGLWVFCWRWGPRV